MCVEEYKKWVFRGWVYISIKTPHSLKILLFVYGFVYFNFLKYIYIYTPLTHIYVNTHDIFFVYVCVYIYRYIYIQKKIMDSNPTVCEEKLTSNPNRKWGFEKQSQSTL